eukprot:TRINITY_DN4005_c0_g1_i1.p1 TRINITY_DN4005_c0_g1~~TRINITY_DN4005_c0_g1_i1.p1  ORF type:complete len:398 (+),score=131.49 TRINITY_DN4005_c0_g1_i1:132-1325(+)
MLSNYKCDLEGCQLTGWLSLPSSSSKTGWKKRLCVLIDTFMFIVENDKADIRKPETVIDLRGVLVSPSRPTVPISNFYTSIRATSFSTSLSPYASSSSSSSSSLSVLSSSSEPEEEDLDFVVWHPKNRARSFLFRVDKPSDLSVWIQTIREIGAVPQTVILEYRGHAVTDEEDASEIKQLEQKTKEILVNQYNKAKGELSLVNSSIMEQVSLFKELKSQKKQLVNEVKTLQSQFQKHQGACQKKIAEYNSIQEQKKSIISSLSQLFAKVQELLDLLEESSTKRLSAKPGSSKMTLPELLDLSSRILHQVSEDVKQLFVGEYPLLRSLICDLLNGYVALREQVNTFTEHVDDLTKEKLARFIESEQFGVTSTGIRRTSMDSTSSSSSSSSSSRPSKKS